jgi:hemolysin III
MGARVAAAVFAVALSGLYAASALLHRLNWAPHMLRRMRKLDYSAIFLLIAGSNTAFALLVLDGPWRVALLVTVWTGAAVGVLLKLLRVDGFRVAVATLYLFLGWVGILAAPAALPRLGVARALLLAAGGALYTLGFVVLARRRPDPIPHVYGYYEVWHTMVVAASLCHYTLVLLLILD